MEVKIRFGAVYRKLLITFLVVALIIGVCMGGLYSQGSRLIRQEILRQIEQENEFLHKILKNEIQRVLALQYKLTNLSDLILLAAARENVRDLNTYQSMLRVQEQLVSLSTSSPLVDSIEIVIPQANLWISNQGIRPLAQSGSQLPALAQQESTDKIITQDGKLHIISSFPPLEKGSEGSIKFLVGASMSSQALSQYLKAENPHLGRALYSAPQNSYVGDPEYRAFFLQVQNNYDLFSSEEQPVRIGEYHYALYPLPLGGLYTVNFIRTDYLYQELVPYQRIFFTLVVLLLVFGVMFLIISFNLIHQPLQGLLHGFQRVRKGDLSVQIQHPANDEFQYIYKEFNDTVTQLQSLIDENYKQQSLLQQAQLKQLQNQINPHFLYNSFISLSHRIDAGDQDYAAELSAELGRYFMFITRDFQRYIPLSQELEHALTYLSIQEKRFRHRLTVTTAPLPEGWEAVEVPRLILQPLIENCFQYVVESTSGPTGITLKFKENKQRLEILISDFGQELSSESLAKLKEHTQATPTGETTGLTNIHQRLQIVYGADYGLSFHKNAQGGLTVTLALAKQRKKEESHV